MSWLTGPGRARPLLHRLLIRWDLYQPISNNVVLERIFHCCYYNFTLEIIVKIVQQSRGHTFLQFWPLILFDTNPKIWHFQYSERVLTYFHCYLLTLRYMCTILCILYLHFILLVTASSSVAGHDPPPCRGRVPWGHDIATSWSGGTSVTCSLIFHCRSLRSNSLNPDCQVGISIFCLWIMINEDDIEGEDGFQRSSLLSQDCRGTFNIDSVRFIMFTSLHLTTDRLDREMGCRMRRLSCQPMSKLNLFPSWPQPD